VGVFLLKCELKVYFILNSETISGKWYPIYVLALLLPSSTNDMWVYAYMKMTGESVRICNCIL
jgi:hypothetical protein